MKKIVFLIALILVTASSVFSQPQEWKNANQLYANGNFEDAAQLYEQLLQNNGVAPELYYNLGNAYFRANEIGKAILNYERALRLKPTYSDARNNLEFAQQKVVDNIDSNGSFFLMQWLDRLIEILRSDQWFYISSTLFILCLILALVFVFGRTVVIRKSAFYVSSIFLAISLVTMLFAGIQKNRQLQHRDAIIMSGVVVVKSAPDKSGTDLFQLHEGTKVAVKSTLGEWAEIKLSNGNIGWVEILDIEKI